MLGGAGTALCLSLSIALHGCISEDEELDVTIGYGGQPGLAQLSAVCGNDQLNWPVLF